MNKFKAPQNAFNKIAYDLNKKVNKPYLNKTVRGFSGNKEPGKNYPLYKSNMLIATKDIVIPKGAFSITVWESKDDFHGNPYRDGVPRADISIAPLSDADKQSLKKSGYIFDEQNLEWISAKFVEEKGQVGKTQSTKGGGHLDTGLNDRVDSYNSNPQSTSTQNYQTMYDDEDDTDIPF